MGRFHKRGILRSSLRVEALEPREMFAADIAENACVVILPQPTVAIVPQPIVAWPVDPQLSLQEYAINKSYEYHSPKGKLESPLTEQAFDAKLKGLVGEYWAGVFGKRPFEVQPIFDQPFFMAFTDSAAGLRAAQPLNSTADRLGVTREITNTRHVGIDEGDGSDMTSDGYLYTVGSGSITAVNLRDPANLTAQAVLPLDAAMAQLIVAGDSLIVLQIQYNTNFQVIRPLHASAQTTRVSLYDISQRMAPRLVSTTSIDGELQTARLTNGQLTLVQNTRVSLPLPALITDTDGVQRYELLDSYYATNHKAIADALQPRYGQSTDGQKPDQMASVGTWDDVTFASDTLSSATTVVRFELSDSSLTLTDSETITGVIQSLVYQGTEDIYLVSFNLWDAAEQQNFIYKIDATDDGQLKFKGMATVEGQITDASWLNEHNGVLQVASAGVGTAVPQPDQATITPGISIDRLPFALAPNNSSANITTIGDTPDGWKVLGTLKDIGDGQRLLAASFVGDRAMLTTGTPLYVDPLHGIDLSDPAHPVELSELVIPGFTTYLQQIDDNHWLGFGYEELERAWDTRLQISLYEGADLANPKLVDRWSMVGNSGGRSWDRHAISYDPATGLLVMSQNLQWQNNSMAKLPVLKVDVNAEDPLAELGTVELSNYYSRNFTLDNVLVVVSQEAISTYDVNNLSVKLGQAALNVGAPIALYPFHPQPTLEPLPTPVGPQPDINADGDVTALDVLQLINYINSSATVVASSESPALKLAATSMTQAVPSNLDINGDGIISALDVLQVVNAINAQRNAASGEGDLLRASVVDQVDFAQLTATDLDWVTRRR